jgi:hypothetical protein
MHLDSCIVGNPPLKILAAQGNKMKGRFPNPDYIAVEDFFGA